MESKMDYIINNSQEFKNLYQKVSDDEKIIEISDAIGITILRNYKKESEYFKDNKKMLINLYLKNNFLVGGINMVEEDQNGLYTIIYDKGKYKKRFTNFSFGPEENIKFIREEEKILVKVNNKKLFLNEFIERLVNNHLSDRLFWVRKKNFFKKLVLNIIFFLSDDKYDFVKYYHKTHQVKENKIGGDSKTNELKIKEEPFFKYFKIYKNTLFIFLIISLFVLVIFQKTGILSPGELTLSNLILLLSFVIILFLLHYLSFFIHKQKQNKRGWIYKLHNSLLNSKFKLKI